MNHLRPLALSQRCQQVTVVSLFPIPTTPKVTWLRPPSWLCRILGATPGRMMFFTLEALRSRPDIVGGFHLIPNGLAAAVLAPLIGARSLYFCGGGPREVLGGGILGNRALEGINTPDRVAEERLIRALNHIDHVICMGERTIRFFRDRGVTARFEVVPGGIDASQFGVDQTERMYDLIFVGRLVKVKRVDLFLETVAILAQSIPDIRAVVVGTGELENELRMLADRLGISGQVRFVGDQADVTTWLRQSRVFVLTSESEGLSLAMMEALTCGLPCVVADVGELGEVVHNGLNGFLVSERTALAFAERIKPFIRDQEALKQLASGAVSSASAFELSQTTNKWDEILQDS